MRTSRKPLVSAVLEFTKYKIDYEEQLDFLSWADDRINDSILWQLDRYEVDRRVTLELWTAGQYYRRNKNNPAIRLANLFEILAFAYEFDDAHLMHGEYCGFDSILGRAIHNQYFPIIYGTTGDEEEINLILASRKESLPKCRLVVTREILL